MQSNIKLSKIYRWLPLVFIAIGIFAFFHFKLYQYLNFQSIRAHRHLYLSWTNQHYLSAVTGFILLYCLIIAISIPGAIFLTFAGGFLFGTVWGTVFVVIGETLGCTVTFLAVKISLGEWIARKASKWVLKMEAEFEKNAFNYIITLRLIPILPFWLVNIAAALLKVSTGTFISSTFLGIIPLTVIYVSLGHSLSIIFEHDTAPNLQIFLSPHIYIPLIALSFFAMFPVAYQYYKKRKS